MAKGIGTSEGRKHKKTEAQDNFDVFINCPFDDDYRPIFNAMVFAVIRMGYVVRCALETDNAGENRLYKIIQIISECRFGIHDISRTELSVLSGLPRFNMPLELGLWLGAHHLGSRRQTGKSSIIFDREKFRYMQFISDINGMDIHAHGGSVETLISELAGWLRAQPGGGHIAGGRAIFREYRDFERILPDLCAGQNMAVEELQYADFSALVSGYVAALTKTPVIPSEASTFRE